MLRVENLKCFLLITSLVNVNMMLLSSVIALVRGQNNHLDGMKHFRANRLEAKILDYKLACGWTRQVGESIRENFLG